MIQVTLPLYIVTWDLHTNRLSLKTPFGKTLVAVGLNGVLDIGGSWFRVFFSYDVGYHFQSSSDYDLNTVKHWSDILKLKSLLK